MRDVVGGENSKTNIPDFHLTQMIQKQKVVLSDYKSIKREREH